MGASGLADRHLVLHYADQQPADYINDCNDQAGDGGVAHELAGTVHGTEEVAFLLQLLAAQLGLILVEQGTVSRQRFTGCKVNEAFKFGSSPITEHVPNAKRPRPLSRTAAAFTMGKMESLTVLLQAGGA